MSLIPLAIVFSYFKHLPSQTAAGKEDQFQLFACFYEASMIERKVGDKMIQFEMSIGRCKIDCPRCKFYYFQIEGLTGGGGGSLVRFTSGKT